MTFMEELLSRRDLLKDPWNLKQVGKKITVFKRLLHSKKLKDKLDRLQRKRYG